MGDRIDTPSFIIISPPIILDTPFIPMANRPIDFICWIQHGFVWCSISTGDFQLRWPPSWTAKTLQMVKQKRIDSRMVNLLANRHLTYQNYHELGLCSMPHFRHTYIIFLVIWVHTQCLLNHPQWVGSKHIMWQYRQHRPPTGRWITLFVPHEYHECLALSHVSVEWLAHCTHNSKLDKSIFPWFIGSIPGVHGKTPTTWAIGQITYLIVPFYHHWKTQFVHYEYNHSFHHSSVQSPQDSQLSIHITILSP